MKTGFAGNSINCPGCGTKIQVPARSTVEEAAVAPVTQPAGEGGEPERGGWVETDPANPNVWAALGLGLGVMALILGVGFVLKGTFIHAILFERGWVNFAETFCFGWGIGILVLKFRKLRHQQNALLLDVLPSFLGKEINRSNVGTFIDHVYSIPVHLRDSLMVNRIRKGLELFEARENNSEVGTMMSNQSNIDSVRISGSYSLLKIFIWVIPILGFVGTVLGLSNAIGNFQGVMGGAKDVDALLASLSGVTGGLGMAFDTTLLGLIYSIILSIPMSALQKIEDDNLNTIDAYCNEILMPRLNDGSNVAGGDMGGLLKALTASLTQAQSQFLTDLNTASKLLLEQSAGLERRANENQAAIHTSFNKSVERLEQETTKALDEVIRNAGGHVADLGRKVGAVEQHFEGIERGIAELNKTLKALNGQQIVIQKQGFLGRLFGKQ